MGAPEVEEQPSLAQAVAALEALAAVFSRDAAAGPALPLPPRRESRAAALPAAVVTVDGEDVVQAADEQAEQLWRCPAVALVGAPLGSLVVSEPGPAGPGTFAMAADGVRIPVSLARHRLRAAEAAGAVLLVSRLDEAAQPPVPTELRYRNLVEQIPAVVFTAALDGGLHDIYVGPQIESLLGYTQEQWLRDPVLWYERLHPEDRDLLDREFARGCTTGGPFRAECRFIAADGRVVWVHGEARLIKDTRGFPLFVQGVAFDITEAKRAEEMVRASLREKELLLKEIHHRVKNNLQVTSSLLRLQAARISEPGVGQTLRESENRIRSIAIVHEMLYRSRDLSRVSFADYARSLMFQLFRSHNVDGRRIRQVVDVDQLELGIDVAVPCGLILNELVANALKHAFPAGRTGTIEVRMTAEKDVYRLRVRDDGVGFPPGMDFRRGTTLGLQLVKTLADQLDGTIELRSAPGAEVTVTAARMVAAK